MKLGSKRGSAVLEAPEENYASSTDEMGWREPAPAGALHRAATADGAAYPAEEPYVPKRSAKASSGFKFKLSAVSVPKSVAGRLVAGSVLFLVLGAAAVTVAGMHHYLLHDDRFSVASSSDIEVLGNAHLTRAQILSVFGADLERNIFKVPLAERRTDLERLPWVAHATVMRLLPNKMRISVVERVPVAFVRQGTDLGLVDASGVLLDMPENTAGDKRYSFPVLTGLAPTDPASTRAARIAVYLKFMDALRDGGSEEGVRRTKTLSEVDLSNPEDVKAMVDLNGNTLVHFGDESFLDRYKAFEQHLPEWRTQYPKLASADMRYERQVVLEMARGAEVPTNTAGPAAAPASTTAAAAVAAPKAEAKPVAVAATKHDAPVAKHEAPVAKHVVAAKPVGKEAAAKKLMAEKLAKARAGLKPVAAHSAKASGVKG